MKQDDIVGNGGDVTTALVLLGTVSELLPPIAAVLAIVWTLIRIYEWARVRLFNKPPTKILS